MRFKRRSGQFDRTISIQNPRISGAFLENVRSLRIKFLREAEGRKVIMVSSTLPGEGKTTVAVNLALTLSQNGARVILVDLDLRKPSVKRCLGVSGPLQGGAGAAEPPGRRSQGASADAGGDAGPPAGRG